MRAFPDAKKGWRWWLLRWCVCMLCLCMCGLLLFVFVWCVCEWLWFGSFVWGLWGGGGVGSVDGGAAVRVWMGGRWR